jgi:hypothetical protein
MKEEETKIITIVCKGSRILPLSAALATKNPVKIIE